jgi:hypothetical protein
MVKTSGGHSLTLDDTPPGKIVLETPLGLSLELDDATGTLTLKAPLAIKLEAPSLEIQGVYCAGACRQGQPGVPAV